MTSWLLETLAWTAVLIAAVLVLRRPVSRWFGPQIAYALWAIPALRLILPPIELPAWMAPAEPAEAAGSGAEIALLDPAFPVATHDGAAGIEAAPVALQTGPATPATPLPFLDFATLIEVGILAWLAGAAIFLYLRFSAYFRLRAELLEDAHEVGRDSLANGKVVRLVETPGTEAPLAFGVFDKVIALPIGFLAHHDRRARDLALAHEMAHHEGRDLLVNVLVQPLFALHWFNPLGRYGWLALRRDQEAACDARVLSAEPAESRPETRDAYANLIVSFAAGPNVAPKTALTAPMACPVLGEKSIIHRLRSLKMTDTPKSRRLTGRLMLGAAAIALPLTASISYAANETPAAPSAPTPPAAALAPLAPAAPLAPVATAAFQDEEVEEEVIVIVDPDTEVSADERREEHVYVWRSKEGGEEGHEMHAEGDERHVERRVERRVIRSDREMSAEERREMMEELREGLAEVDEAFEDMPRTMALAIAEAEGGKGHTVVRMQCDNNSDEVATTTENDDGTRTVMICQTRVMAHALKGLQEARAAIARNENMTEDMRAQVLAELDSQIERWENRAR